MTPRYPANRADRRAVLAACLLVWTVPLAAWLPTARADVATDVATLHASEVCAFLDNTDTPEAFDRVAVNLKAWGLSSRQAADALIQILGYCPRHLSAAQRWANTPDTPKAGSVGGAYRI